MLPCANSTLSVGCSLSMASTVGSPQVLMSALRACASGDSRKSISTCAASLARALNGIARKCVLAMVPAVCCQLITVSGRRLAAISLAASFGLKVSVISSSPSAIIWRMSVLVAGNCLPCRHSTGCKASSVDHSGAVRREKRSVATGA